MARPKQNLKPVRQVSLEVDILDWLDKHGSRHDTNSLKLRKILQQYDSLKSERDMYERLSQRALGERDYFMSILQVDLQLKIRKRFGASLLSMLPVMLSGNEEHWKKCGEAYQRLVFRNTFKSFLFCKVCDEEFFLRETLEAHNDNEHYCNSCGYFDSKKEEHMAKEHPMTK